MSWNRQNKVPSNPVEFREYIYNLVKQPNDTQESTSNISKLGLIKSQISTARVEHLKSLYLLGQTIAKDNDETTRLCGLYGISRKEIWFAKRLVQLYPNLESCEADYLDKGCPPLGKFVGEKRNPPQVPTTINSYIRDIEIAMDYFLNKENLSDEDLPVQEKLVKLFNKLSKHLPLKVKPDNTVFFEYGFCVACGTDEFADKLTLRKHPKFISVYLPYCNQCDQLNKPYDPELVIKLYGAYVSQLEEYLNRL